MAQEPRFQYDLSATLYKSRWIYEQPVDGGMLLFTPDRKGMPIVVDADIYQLINQFNNGCTVGGLLARQRADGTSNTGVFTTLVDLVERGILREEPDPDSFEIIPYNPKRTSLNVWLHVNNNCNLACSYCFVEHTPSRMNRNTMDEVIAKLQSTAKQYGVEQILIKFAGGEPSLSLDELEYFQSRITDAFADCKTQVRFCMLTNGTVLSQRVIDFLLKTNATISISLDGYGKYHDIYRIYRTDRDDRIVGSWNKIAKNIAKLRALGIEPYINAMAGPKTCEGLPDLAEWAFGSGLLGTIHVVRNLDDSWSNEPREKQYHDYYQRLMRAFDETFTRLERPEFPLKLPRWIELAELYFDDPAPSVCCGIGTDHLVITHEGLLASCPMTVHEAHVKPSHDLFDSAQQTFTASPHQRQDDECLHCQWYRVCASACPVANERIQGHPFTRSPLCEFWKYVIPRYIQFYGKKLTQQFSRCDDEKQTA